jgi:hypothetical protein
MALNDLLFREMYTSISSKFILIDYLVRNAEISQSVKSASAKPDVRKAAAQKLVNRIRENYIPLITRVFMKDVEMSRAHYAFDVLAIESYCRKKNMEELNPAIVNYHTATSYMGVPEYEYYRNNIWYYAKKAIQVTGLYMIKKSKEFSETGIGKRLEFTGLKRTLAFDNLDANVRLTDDPGFREMVKIAYSQIKEIIPCFADYLKIAHYLDLRFAPK